MTMGCAGMGSAMGGPGSTSSIRESASRRGPWALASSRTSASTLISALRRATVPTLSSLVWSCVETSFLRRHRESNAALWRARGRQALRSHSHASQSRARRGGDMTWLQARGWRMSDGWHRRTSCRTHHLSQGLSKHLPARDPSPRHPCQALTLRFVSPALSMKWPCKTRGPAPAHDCSLMRREQRAIIRGGRRAWEEARCQRHDGSWKGIRVASV